jgi:ADP-heptose:LPS heptosyltransferase
MFWGEFDRFSTNAAGDRVLDTFQRTGFESLRPVFRVEVRNDVMVRAENILRKHGWDGTTRLVVLNPAGLWRTRNWPIENYVELANLWLAEERVQFLLLGTGRIDQKALYISHKLPDSTINLVGKTTLAEAFGIVQYTSAVISEDSGLMHMAWVSGIPTLALFGSSRHDWSRPLGEHSLCLHSGDLECGACMKTECKYGDVHCLTRYTAEYVYEKTQKLLHTSASKIAL